MNGYANQSAASRSVRILALAATLVASAARADVTTTLTESWLVVKGDGGPDAVDISSIAERSLATGASPSLATIHAGALLTRPAASTFCASVVDTSSRIRSPSRP